MHPPEPNEIDVEPPSVETLINTETESKPHKPLYVQVFLAITLGCLVGVVFQANPILGTITVKDLGLLGMLVIRMLKALAAPLILLAILDAFAKTEITGRDGLRLIAICLGNLCVAFAVGLSILNLFKPGLAWESELERLKLEAPSSPVVSKETVSLSPLQNLSEYVPESLLGPLVTNNLATIVLCGLLGGAALRVARRRQLGTEKNSVESVVRFVEGALEILLVTLEWVIRFVPIAVFGLVAQVVGNSGIGVFKALGIYLVTILSGLAIHSLIYYPALAYFLGKKSPRVFLGGGADAIITGFSSNSSLATVPVTLRCLNENMGVSEKSSRLAACVGTNFNNDGITLYEAMTALFLAQALGWNLGLEAQVGILLASVLASVGVAGIPEAGLIVLPLVLASAGLPEALVASVIPLILPVEWLIARCRSGVNVLSDMVVAVCLDATDPERSKD